MSIWTNLKKPFLILAPMEDVTDSVFRQIIVSCGKPDLFFTEFTNVEGLMSAGERIVSQRLKFTQIEHPIIAQVWGKNPEHFATATKKIIDLGFDGIDINMGCPEKSVTKQGCGSAQIANPELAHQIIQATLDAADGSAGRRIPVSVKTRIGTNTIVTDTWIPFLLSHPIDALTIHGRTAREESKVPCHWDEIGKAVQIRNKLGSNTLIIGNGDVLSTLDAEKKATEYGVDGVMIGRGIFKNPFLFSENPSNHTVGEYLNILIGHVELFEKTWGQDKHYPILKKFYKIYVSDFPGAGDLRAQLMETNTTEEAREIVKKYKVANLDKLKENRA